MFNSQPFCVERIIERNSFREDNTQTFLGTEDMWIRPLKKGETRIIARKLVMAFSPPSNSKYYDTHYGRIELKVQDLVFTILDGNHERIWIDKSTEYLDSSQIYSIGGEPELDLPKEAFTIFRLATCPGGMSRPAYEEAANVVLFDLVFNIPRLCEWFQKWFPDWARWHTYQGHIKLEPKKRKCPRVRKKYMYYTVPDEASGLTEYTAEECEDEQPF